MIAYVFFCVLLWLKKDNRGYWVIDWHWVICSHLLAMIAYVFFCVLLWLKKDNRGYWVIDWHWVICSHLVIDSHRWELKIICWY